MRQLSPLLLALLCLVLPSYSQNFIKGSVTDSSQLPISYCAMALLNSADSSLNKGNISDSSGFFIFENIEPGNYFIKFTNVGYKSASTPSFTIDSVSQIVLPGQILKPEGVILREVSISDYKPAIEFKKGKVIMNVETDLLAKGNTVLELLKRIPGVIVDAQNNITINGIGGALFLIDDRLQQMPVPQVIDMLSGMSADAVSTIELIKNPPARYDAAGTGGLINIVTKRARLKGYNGSISFIGSHGQRVRWGPFFSFNYKSNKLTVFTNFSYAVWEGINFTFLNRSLAANGNTERINSRGITESYQQIFSGNGGIEYDIHPKTLLGFYVNGNLNEDQYHTQTQTEIINSTSFNYSRLFYATRHKFRIISPSYTLSLLQKLNSTGGQLKLSAGYNNYLEMQDKRIENNFYDDNDLKVAPASNYNTLIDRDFKIFTQKVDLNKTFNNKLSVETGLKSSFVNNLSSTVLNFSNQSTGLFIGDTIFHNAYQYRERILAAYLSLARSWDKIGFSAGLRAEQTDINANDPITGYTFRRNYFNFFPSGSMDLTLNKKNTITSAYSFRIDRPHYGMLNPVRILNEQLNYGVGNPELKPSYTHNITLDYNYSQFLTLSLGLNKTKDFPYWYSYTPDSSKVNIDTLFNYPGRNNLYYSLSAQKRIKWYSFQTYGIIMYRALKGVVQGEEVNSETFHYYFNLNQEVYLPKDFKVQLWCGFGSGFKDGPQYYYPRSAIHLSINKTFLEKKLSITLSYHDLLYKDYASYSSTLSDQDFFYKEKFDTRRMRLNINYRFGKMRIEQRLKEENDMRLRTGK